MNGLVEDWMEFFGTIDLRFSLSGFLVGMLVGQTGVGGGSLMTPLLVLGFGVHPATAVGTDLLYAAATKAVGTLAHGFHGTVNWRVTGRLAMGSVPATLVTLLVMSQFNTLGSGSARVLSIALGVALVLTGVALLARRRVLAISARGLDRMDERAIVRATVITGAVLGCLVSLSSVGAGAIGMTVLLMLYRHLPLPKIVGSDIAHAVPLTLIAGIGHWLVGSVDWSMLASLLVGSVPGIIAGTLLSVRLPDWFLRPILAITLLIVGGRLLL
jgi:uncharacterized membrane protein YfcA